LLALALFAFGCARDNTQLVVAVDSDLQPKEQLGAVRIRLVNLGSTLGDQIREQSTFIITDSPSPQTDDYTLPLSFAVVPPNGNATSSVTLDITALGADGQRELFTRRVSSGFRSGKSLLLPVYLSKDCLTIAKQCPEQTTCTELGCESPRVAVTSLNEIDPGQETSATLRKPGVNPYLNPDAGSKGMSVNNPPSTPGIELSATSTGTLGNISVNIIEPATDPDNDAISYRYRWFKNGERQAELLAAELPNSQTAKEQVWRVEVFANDGMQDSLMAASATVTIINTAPAITLKVVDEPVRSDEDLVVSVIAYDPDSDLLDYRLSVRQNGRLTQTSSNTLPQSGQVELTLAQSDEVSKSDIWAVDITVSDGEESSSLLKQDIEIVSAPPTVVSATIQAFTSSTSTTAALPVTTTAFIRLGNYEVQDQDVGDVVSYLNVEWLVGGQTATAGKNLFALDPQFTRKNNDVLARVTAVDQDNAASEPQSSNVISVVNTPPQFRNVYIAPEANPTNRNCQGVGLCTVADNFRCLVDAVDVIDPDGDAIEFRYQWFRNSLLNPLANISEIYRGNQAGRFWALVCGITPFDGEAVGDLSSSPPVLIGNAPPSISTVDINPKYPKEGDIIVATATGTSDLENDNVTLRYEWLQNGVVIVGQTGTTLNSNYFDKDDRIQVRVFPIDGFDVGDPLLSGSSTVVNTPPSITGIQIAPDFPDTTSAIVAIPLGWSDPDPADKEDYQYTWHFDARNTSTTAVGIQPVVVNDPVYPPALTLRDLELSVTVIPSDSDSDGQPVRSATITIRNSPPSAPVVKISPDAPGPNDDLVCEFQFRSTDPDFDPLTYAYQWSRNSQTMTSQTSSVVTASVTQDQDVWSCRITPSDGLIDGPAGFSAVTIGTGGSSSNSIPNALHAAGDDTCWIQEGNAPGVLCWNNSAVQRFAGVFTSFIDTPNANCLLQEPDLVTCVEYDESRKEFILDTFEGRDITLTPDQYHYVGGDYGVCFLDGSGQILCTEENAPLSNLSQETFVEIIGGDRFGCGLLANQTLRCWGDNASNQATPPGGRFIDIRRPLGARYTEALETTGTWVKWGFGLNFSPTFSQNTKVPLVTNEVQRGLTTRIGCARGGNDGLICASRGGYHHGVDAVPDVLFKDFAIGANHVCGLTLTNQPICWGSQKAPTQVSGGQPISYTKIAVGYQFACGIDTSRQLHCWGYTNNGHAPNEAGLHALGINGVYVDLWARDTELCARRSNGDIDCFGERFQKVKQVELSRAGNPGTSGRSHAVLLESGARVRTDSYYDRIRAQCQTLVPRGSASRDACISPGLIGHIGIRNLDSATYSGIQTIAIGGDFECIVDDSTNGQILCTGSDTEGQTTPPQGQFTQVTAGNDHACGLTSDGRIYCWGNDTDGQATAPSYSAANPFAQISSGWNHNCALRQDGSIVCWGNISQAPPSALGFAQVSSGDGHSCALDQNNHVYCWGLDSWGQSSPPLTTSGSPIDFSHVSAGNVVSCGVKTTGELLCWGYSQYLASISLHGLPPSSHFDRLVFSPKHYCGITASNGTVSCVGADSYAESSQPSAVTLSGADSSIFVRENQTCLLQSAHGGLDCYGEIQEAPPTGFNFIEAGLAQDHGCGIATNTSTTNTSTNTGGIVCWGVNYDGRSTVPSSLSTRHDFVDIDCADENCLALTQSGEVFGFGNSVPADAPISGVTTGLNSTIIHLVYNENGGCVLDTDGAPYCFGDQYIKHLPLTYEEL